MMDGGGSGEGDGGSEEAFWGVECGGGEVSLKDLVFVKAAKGMEGDRRSCRSQSYTWYLLGTSSFEGVKPLNDCTILSCLISIVLLLHKLRAVIGGKQRYRKSSNIRNHTRRRQKDSKL